MQKHTIFYELILLLVITAAVRGGLLCVAPASLTADPDGYYALARNLQSQGVFGTGDQPTAFRPPLYPFALRQCFRLTGETPDKVSPSLVNTQGQLSSLGTIALFHVLLGLATVFLTVRTALLMGLNRFAALVAGFLVCMDPILLAQSRVVMTETFATFWAILILWGLVHLSLTTALRRQLLWSGTIGLLAGLATLCRPAFLGWAGLLTLALVFTRRQKFFAPLPGVCFLIGLALVMLPWTVRNYRAFDGRIIPTTTHDGYTLLLANNDYLYNWQEQHAPWEKLWDPTSFHLGWGEELARRQAAAGITFDPRTEELFQNEQARQEALRTIQARPGSFVKSAVIRVGCLFQCLPYRTEGDGQESSKKALARTAVAVFYFVEYVFALIAVGLFIRRSRSNRQKGDERRPSYRVWLWGALLILSVLIPHLMFWTNMRMRSVFMVFIAILAASVFGMATEDDENQEDKGERLKESERGNSFTKK